MKAAVYHTKKGLPPITLENVPKPEPKNGEVVVKIKYCGICGTDLEAYKSRLFPFDVIIGHEPCGIIEELGPDVKKLKKGQRIAIDTLLSCGECFQCRSGNDNLCTSYNEIGVYKDGAFAEYLSVPAKNVIPIPDVIPDKFGTVFDQIATTLLALRVGDFKFGETAVVIGLGTIGQFLIQCLKYAGAATIIAIEKNATRLEIVKKFNPDLVLDKISLKQIKKATNRRGTDYVFNCTSAPAVIDASFDLLRKGGKLIQIGAYENPVNTNFLKIMWNQFGIQGVQAYAARDFLLAIDLVAKKIINPDPIITKIISLDNIVEEGFENLLDTDTKDIKILVEP